jgi:GNAT superfamily N-acetyltransferase
MDQVKPSTVTLFTADNMKINKVTSADIGDLSSIFDEYRQFYGQESDLKGAASFLEGRINNGESTAFMAIDLNGRAMGFTQLYPSFSSVSMARIFVLNDLFVRPEYRGYGLARELIAEAIRFAKEEGAIRLSLSTARTNLAAQSLYEKTGWKKDEQFLSYDFSVLA